MTGKNFSCNNVAGQRKKSDFYETPYSMTGRFLEEEYFDSALSFCEPACGKGAIVKVLQEITENITSYDIEKNFLLDDAHYDYIITNPPFSLAYEFIQQAKKLTRKKFAFLLPLSYLHGKKRFDHVYSDREFPLAGVYVFTRYPMLGEPLREDGKYNTGMMVYAWFVFDRTYEGEPIIRWIDNNDDVLSKRNA